MSSYQRRKGHDYERFIARWYREHGREAKRGFQSRGGTEQSDVMVEGFSVECKCTKVQPNIPKAMQQAIDCARDGETPLVHFKVTGKGDYVVLRLSDWAEFLESGRR